MNNIEKQYQTAKNLNTRISIHDKYSTNHQPFGDWIMSHYEIKPGYRILEMGCGTGDMWKDKMSLLDGGSHLTLTDFSLGMLETAKKNIEVSALVDFNTNIPTEILWQISDYNHVAIMLSPQAMSADRFFDRTDPEKQFLLSVIEKCPDPKAALDNFRNCIAAVNSPERYNAFLNSGFFTLIRPDDGRDTREEMLTALTDHFGLAKGGTRC